MDQKRLSEILPPERIVALKNDLKNYKIYYSHGICRCLKSLKYPEFVLRNNYSKQIPISIPIKIIDEIERLFYSKKDKDYNKGIEFTIAECSEQHIIVVAIVKEGEQFIKKEGILWVQLRMWWALTHSKESVNRKWWGVKY